MAKPWSRMFPILLGVSAISGGAAAQPGLTGVILHGASTRPGSAQLGAPTILTPGVRVESPRVSWTEIAFSDGSSVVLDPGADFTLQGIEKDPDSGHLVIRAAAGRGRIRVETSDGVDVLLTTPGAQVRVVAATAVVTAGGGGSATLIGGRRLVVQRGADEDIVRRPGFTVVFDNGTRRETRPELAEAIDPFAPVKVGGANLAGVEVPSATASTGASTASLPTGLNANQGIGIPTATLGSNSATGTSPGTGNTAGTGSSPGTGGNAGAGGTSGGGTSPPPAVPRAPQNFSLVAASLPTTIGAAPGSTIAAPGANSVTSSIDAQGNFVSVSGRSLAEVTRLVDFTPLGTARVRRFAPDASGFSMPRNDTGVVSVPGAGSGIGNSFFQNLATSTLATSGTFYDAVAKVGTVVLTVDQVNSSGVVSNPPQTTTVPRISVTDTAPSVADPLQSTQRPFLFFDSNTPTTPPKKEYFGSAVFENGLLNNTPANGKITALSGDNGLIMFIAAPGNPPAIPLGTATANDFNNICTANQGGCPTGRHNTKVEQPVQPGVFIVDKVHTTTGSSTDNSDTRGIELGERFFVIGGTPLPPTPTGLPGAPPGTVTRFAISDGLNPLGGFATGKSIEDQFVGPGSSQQPVAFNQYNAFRPEETFVAGAARGDTHLWVISDATGRNPAMRADLQIAADGRSSASASVGGIGTLPNGSLALSGATVGSAQLATNASALSITGNLGSLGTDATGTGAHVFGGSGKAPGQIGYFAVSQADVRLGAPGTPAGDQPGTLQVVGQPGNTAPFAFTRLATNVGAPATLASPGQLNSQGFATGVVQSFTNGQGSLYALSSTRLGDVAITSSPPNTGFTSTLAMSPTSVGELSSDPLAAPAPGGVTGVTTLSFGGSQATPPSTALVSPATFAAVAPGIAMASIDNDLLAGIENRSGSIAHPVTGAPVDASLPPSNEHLAWGFFLGDLVNQANGQRQDHVNLGFWVAGQPVTFAMLQTLTGTATYGGGLVGTAVEPGRIATVVGQFAQQWNFAARTGTMNASFDSASWNGLGLNMPATTNVFSGTGSSSNIADRTLAVQGSFFHNTATGGALSSTNLPAAVGGLFAIHNSTGTYGANGVLVGARR